MADTTFILWVQQLARPWLTNIMLAVTALGTMEYYMVAIPVVYWLIDKHLGARFAAFFAFSAFTNSCLKYLFQAPRPPLEIRLAVQEGYSFPSGHAQGSTAFWGFLALELRKPWAWAGAAALIALISFSRIYLGVHYPIDIVGGIAVGAMLLWGYSALAKHLPRRVPARSWIWPVLGIGAILYLIHPTGDGPVTVGFVVGGLVGYVLESQTLDFSSRGSAAQQVLKVLLGVAALFALRIGLKPVTGLLPGATGDLVRYALLALWVTWGAPWLFVRLGLAEANRPITSGPSIN